ncbi:TraB/GumN family protein [Frigidibacter sp. RF13]|uniref:TraB/GumN family protein n=1 Tax=Frigidibacter sp. RF13 TaxID=2997340 RepID=UPI00226E2A8C|nr:TraB/GumN family protein [Frigidibacter sp. RF13]
MRLRHGLWGVALASLTASGAVAQDWITPESCRVTIEDLAAAMPDPDAAEVRQDAARIPNGQGRLWRITTPEGAVSHLWGTLHSSDPAILDLPPELRSVLDAARTVVLESDPRAKSRTELEERFLQAGVWLADEHMPYDKPYLGGAERGWVEARIEGIFHGPEAFAALTDAGLAFYLMADPCEDFTAGVLPVQDQRLLLAAVEAGAGVGALESWDALLVELSQPDRRDTAQAVVRIQGAYLNPDGFSAARVAAFRLYREGRIGELMEWNRRYLAGLFGPGEAEALMGRADGYLLDERNGIFLRRMEKFLTSGGALVAVGAFHLPGGAGLIERLRRAGYLVERIAVRGEAG